MLLNFVGNFVANFVEMPRNSFYYLDKVSDEVFDKVWVRAFWDKPCFSAVGAQPAAGPPHGNHLKRNDRG